LCAACQPEEATSTPLKVFLPVGRAGERRFTILFDQKQRLQRCFCLNGVTYTKTGFGTALSAGLFTMLQDRMPRKNKFGVLIERLLQTIASGALGPSAFHGAKRTAAINVFFNFFNRLRALIYYAISRKMSASSTIRCSAVLSTAARFICDEPHYHPLSAAPKREFSAKPSSPS
jgi:hypothetical protein